jgi:hypothetical protein
VRLRNCRNQTPLDGLGVNGGLLLCFLLSSTAFAQSPLEPRISNLEPRTWLFAIGTNRGIEGDETLHFATLDAARVAETLREVGGLDASRQRLLGAVDANQARSELAAFASTLKAQAQPGDRLVLYVSSHADDEALHLTGTALPLAELVRFLKDAPVSVGLFILDACRSGAATLLQVEP